MDLNGCSVDSFRQFSCEVSRNSRRETYTQQLGTSTQVILRLTSPCSFDDVALVGAGADSDIEVGRSMVVTRDVFGNAGRRCAIFESARSCPRCEKQIKRRRRMRRTHIVSSSFLSTLVLLPLTH